MKDKIKVAGSSAWRFLVNGSEVARGDASTSGDTSLVLQVDQPWTLTATPDGVQDPGPDPEPPDPGPDPEPSGDWPVIPQSMVDTALKFPLIKYGNKGNSNCNYGALGTALFTTVYAYIGGDERSDVRNNVTAILGQLTSPDKGPCGMNGPGAQLEALALTWFHMYRRSDLWAGTSDNVKARIDAIFHALALIRAWEGNDSSKSHGEWTITGMKGTDFKDVGPNISFPIPAVLILCGEWFGYDELNTFLNSTSIAAVRSEVKSAFGGTSGNLYKTLNWRNAGISESEQEQYYRSDTSAAAPSDSDINASLANLKYYGAPMTDLAKFLLPNDERGLNKVLPPSKRTAGSNKYVGVNQYAVDGDKGVTVDGKKRGYCLGDTSKMPHHPGEGAMVYEINGVDGGGIRSAMGYAFWTVYITNCMLLPMAANSNIAFEDDGVDDFMERWSQAYDIMSFFDEEDYNSIAHIGTKNNGGPGPIVWSEGRDSWHPDIQFFFWDAIMQIVHPS